MHHFLRILAGAGDMQPAASNDELVGTLRRCAVIKTYVDSWLYVDHTHPHHQARRIRRALRVCT